MELKHRFRFNKSRHLATGAIKSNLTRIAQKIEEKDPELPEGETNLFRITDMIRGTVLVSSVEHLKEAYEMID